MSDPDYTIKSTTNAKVITINNPLSLGYTYNTLLSDSIFGVVNGPLVNRHNKPVGEFIYDKKQENKRADTPSIHGGNFAYKNGTMICDYAGNVRLIEKGDTAQIKLDKIKWGFQNGPVLVKNGEITHNAEAKSKKFRSGLGYNDENKLVVIFSEKPVNMHEFAEEFVTAGCKNAIYLDGDASKCDSDYVGYNFKEAKDGMRPNRFCFCFKKQ